MAMNTNLLNALKEIVSRYGGIATLSDARRVKALLADLAAGEPKSQKNALIACVEQGFVAILRKVPAGERGKVKVKLVERLNLEEGLDLALCADTLDLLEAVVPIPTGSEPEPQKEEAAATEVVTPQNREQVVNIPIAPQNVPPPVPSAKLSTKSKTPWVLLFVDSLVVAVVGIVVIYASVSQRETQQLSEDDLIGIWEGSYFASQGETALVLIVYKERTNYMSIFTFFNLPGKSNSREGSYYMRVAYNQARQKFYLKAIEWIEQPSDYDFVDLEGIIAGDVFTGDVFSGSMRYTFRVVKQRELDKVTS